MNESDKTFRTKNLRKQNDMARFVQREQMKRSAAKLHEYKMEKDSHAQDSQA